MAAEKAMMKGHSRSNCKAPVVLSNPTATRTAWSKSNIASVIPARRRSVKRIIFDDMVKSVVSLVSYCCSSSSSYSAYPEDEATRGKNAKKNSAVFPDPLTQLN